MLYQLSKLTIHVIYVARNSHDQMDNISNFSFFSFLLFFGVFLIGYLVIDETSWEFVAFSRSFREKKKKEKKNRHVIAVLDYTYGFRRTFFFFQYFFILLWLWDTFYLALIIWNLDFISSFKDNKVRKKCIKFIFASWYLKHSWLFIHLTFIIN